MKGLIADMKRSPLLARVAPYVAFLVLTQVQGSFGEPGRYWIYLAKTLVGAWLVWEVRGVVAEMRWKFSWEAVVVGVGVFVMWVGIDPFYPGLDAALFKLGLGQDPAKTPVVPWNPFAQFGAGTLAAWFFVVVRTVGSTLVVPPLEEVFFRSFLYRYLISPEFERVALDRWHKTSILLTSLFFAAVHQEWLAGILCGVAYQCLAIRKKRLGDAITAHAITNFLLAAWVVFRPDWKFW